MAGTSVTGKSRSQTNYCLNIGMNPCRYGSYNSYRIEYKLPGHEDFNIICTEENCKHAVSLLGGLGIDAFIGYVTRVIPREKAEREVKRHEKALKESQDALNALMEKDRRATP